MELLNSALNARVQRGFAFVDVCGFTQVLDRRGDASALRMLSEFRAQVRAACGHYGVRVGKWLGDGAMLVGVDPVQLLCAAVTIVGDAEGVPPVRGGLAVGGVLVFEGDDYVGRTVNLAARLCDAASAGQLLVAPSGELSLPATLHAVPHPPLSIRGFQEQVDTVTVRVADAHRPGRALGTL